MKPSASPGPANTAVASRGAIACVAVLLALATVVVYLNSLRAPFVFDDLPSIPGNATLEKLWPLSGPLSPPGVGLTVSGRPLLNLSFALNRAMHAGPAGFRATNIAIHLGAGLLLFGLVRRTLLQPRLRREFGAKALPLAAAIAALWLLHPLQTSAVTYVVQRAESLMGCCYLLTLYAFIRATAAPRPARWFALAWLACLLGMATKEVMVSAPVLVALYDRLFLAATWREVWQRRKMVHLALAATWLLLAWLVIGSGGRGGTTGFSLGVGWMDYGATQFHAVVNYLALVAWPQPLVLDHGVRWARGLGDIAPAAAVVLALLAVTVAALRRGRPVAFAGVWFFAVLAPTSVLPGGRQTMADHRMYLPLAAVIALAVLWSHRRLGRRALVGACLAALLCGTLTVWRNSDYRSVLAIWADTVAKRPDNRWARDNLGNALLEAGRPAEALVHYGAAMQLAPDDAVHHHNAANALALLGRWDEARAGFAEAVRCDGHYLPARTGLGHALSRLGRFDEAAAAYRVVTAAEPHRAKNHAHLADALFFAGRSAEAIAGFKVATQLEPANAEFAYALGCLLLQTARPAEAAEAFASAVRNDPHHGEAYNNLGSALAQLGRRDDALRHIREAVRLNPNNSEARQNLERLARIFHR